MRPVVFIFTVLLAIGLVGCSKSQFTKPVPVGLVLQLDKTPAVNGTIIPEELTLRPISFIVEGTRAAAEPITFTRDLAGTRWAVHQQESVDMDLPQGVYEYLRLSVNFMGDPNFEEDIADEIDEWWQEIQQGGDGEETLYDIVDQFDDDAKPALWLEAAFMHPTRGEVDIYLTIPKAWVLEVLATQNGSISLSADDERQSTIAFSVAEWFSNVSVAALEQAYYAADDDDVILFIHPRVNTTLYTLIIDQIANAQRWAVL